MIYVFILCLFMLFLSFVCSKNNIFSPGIITSSVWIFCLSVFCILHTNLPPLSCQFLSALSIWVSLLCLSSLFVQSLAISSNENREPSKLVRDIYFLLSIATYPMLLLFAYNAIKFGHSGSWSLDLRLASLGRSLHTIDIYDPLYVLIWLSSYLIELVYFSKKNRERVFLLGFIYLSFGFFTMSKTVFLNFFILTVCVLYFKKIISLKHILIGLFVLFFLFIAFQNLRQSSSLGKGDFLELYLLSSMSAFDKLVPFSSLHWGENVFRVFYAISYKAGLSNIAPISPILPWITQPIETNTYTGMYPFFKDFGYWGIISSSLLLGTLLGWIFKKAKQNDKLFILIYAYFANAILMQYVGDMFVTYISGHIKMIIILVLPFLISKYKLNSEKIEKS